MAPLGPSQWARNSTAYSSLYYNKADIELLLYCKGGNEGCMDLKSSRRSALFSMLKRRSHTLPTQVFVLQDGLRRYVSSVAEL
jgi:hypothetical protein